MNKSGQLIEAYFFGNPKFIGDKILFIKRDTRLEEYKQHLLNVHEFGNIWHGITGILADEKISIIAAGIGPSMIGDALYALDRPGTVCIYSGTCGGLGKNLEIGDYFIAEQAICGDGYSFHFDHAPLSIISGDFGLLDVFKTLLFAKVNRMWSGTTFTTSSVVRESDADFWKIVSPECQIIEMAAAAFYAAASATRKKAAAYYWVTDLPSRGKSFFDPLTEKEIRIKQNRYERSVTLDLDLISSM